MRYIGLLPTEGAFTRVLGKLFKGKLPFNNQDQWQTELINNLQNLSKKG